MTEEEDYKYTYPFRIVMCDRCGKTFSGRRNGQKYVYCPDCKKIIAESKDIERRNKEYEITHKWSRKEDCIADNASKAKAMGMSYGKYMALMSQLEYKRELERKAQKMALKDTGVIKD